MRNRLKRASRLDMRITDVLRAELDVAADEEARTISAIAERVLIEWATQRVIRRQRCEELAGAKGL